MIEILASLLFAAQTTTITAGCDPQQPGEVPVGVTCYVDPTAEGQHFRTVILDVEIENDPPPPPGGDDMEDRSGLFDLYYPLQGSFANEGRLTGCDLNPVGSWSWASDGILLTGGGLTSDKYRMTPCVPLQESPTAPCAGQNAGGCVPFYASCRVKAGQLPDVYGFLSREMFHGYWRDRQRSQQCPPGDQCGVGYLRIHDNDPKPPVGSPTTLVSTATGGVQGEWNTYAMLWKPGEPARSWMNGDYSNVVTTVMQRRKVALSNRHYMIGHAGGAGAGNLRATIADCTLTKGAIVDALDDDGVQCQLAAYGVEGLAGACDPSDPTQYALPPLHDVSCTLPACNRSVAP